MRGFQRWLAGLASFASLLAGNVPVPIANPGFESERNPTGDFSDGTLSALSVSRWTGWTTVAADNTGVGSAMDHQAVGWRDLQPGEPPQALRMVAGSVIAQVTGLRWSSLVPGDVLTCVVAAGDPAWDPFGSEAGVWADDSFVGLSDGMVRREGPASRTGWLGGVVARQDVPEPPQGAGTGIMGDVIMVHEVTEQDVARQGRVGVFMASLGSAAEEGEGTGSGWNMSHWDNVRLELTTSRPFVAAFGVSPMAIEAGDSATLTWEVTGADRVRIEPSVGEVPGMGSATVKPGATTTYRLEASNATGTSVAEATLGVAGPPPYRFYRFLPTALRASDRANSVQLGEFGVLLGTNRVTGAVATNPGGRNPGNEGPMRATDGDPATKWLDFNKGTPLVLDYGRPVLADGYRLASANDAPERDPVSWRVDGSPDGATWIPLDEQVEHPFPERREAWADALAFGLMRGPAVVLTADSTDLVRGQATILRWGTANADAGTVRIDPGVGVVGASGTRTVAPGETTAYELRASKGGVERRVTVTVQVSLVAPPEVTLTASALAVAPGQPVTLAWNVANATNVVLTPGAGEVASTGTRVMTPSETTTYAVTATGGGGTRTATVRVEVTTRGLMVRTYDTREGDSWLDPISNLIAAKADGTGIQGEDIRYDGDFVGRLPGLTGTDSFSVLWTGWLDVRVHGPGSYTFGTRSDDGSTWWLDLNHDGKFDGPGEKVVDNNGLHPASTATGTVELGMDMVRVAIGYYEAGGQEVMEARFGRGADMAFEELGAVPGADGAFSVTEPSGGAPYVRFTATPAGIQPGGSVTLSWQVDKATETRIEPGIGPVATSGTAMVKPTANTTYTLTATGPGGTRTAEVRVVLVEGGPYRLYRFVPTRFRDAGENSVQMAEFQMLRNGARLGGATASNPGGNNPGGETPFHGNDNSVDTKWLDFRKGALVLDFGVPVAADGYRWATANDADGRDPLSWRVEGSHDGTNWATLDTRDTHPTPRTRKTFVGPFSLGRHPAFTMAVPVRTGTGLALDWDARPGTTYRVETSMRPTDPGSWEFAGTNVLAPGSRAGWVIPATGDGARFYRVVALP